VSEDVFFNPKMKCLRDISVAFIRATAVGKPSLLDSTSATGIRGIRYSKEAGISNLTLLDVNKKAATNTRKNLKANKVKAKILNVDLQDFVRGYEKKFNVIDLDPFGSPAPYIHDLLKISEDGTVLMITATDTAVLCGAHSAACVKQYGSLPLHNELCKEVGIRILISYLIRKSAEFNFGVTVMLSISDMHYMRVFIRLDKGAKKAYESMISTGFGSYCNKCSSFDFAAGITPKLKAKCKNCGYGMQQFGPLFLGKLNDKTLLKKMLDVGLEDELSEKTVRLLYEEYETPFFYSLPKITRHLGISSVPYETVCKKLGEKGYAYSHTLFDINGLKTNAPVDKLSKAVSESKVK
jgi:tRNA (guanine26-N2/guanine27-N2)-dimethyltransferase